MLLSSRTMPAEVHGNGRFVLPARDFRPAYLKAYEEGRLKAKVDEALEALRSCTLCPRDCHIDRLANKFAVCKSGRYAKVSSYFHHFGEEDVLRGWRGSGTIFFSWCNLRCVFCFNADTRVHTDKGLHRIEDIFDSGREEIAKNGGRIRFIHGFRVWTAEGTLAAISKAFCHHYKGEMIVIKPYGLPALTVTPDHTIFASLGPGAEVQKIPAGALTRSHFLLVPKPQPIDDPVELDTLALLQPCVTTFRRSNPRKVSIAVLQEIAAVRAKRRLTSNEIGRQLGYHPAYVRTLMSRLRHGRITHDEPHIRNDLIVEDGRVRFKTQKNHGIPTRVVLDSDLARLLGYYCAEGHVASPKDRPNSHRLIFSYGRHEQNLAEHTCALLRKLFSVEPASLRRRTTVTVEVGNSLLALLFASLCGRVSRDKRVPALLFSAPTSIIRAFLDSYWAGDGCRQSNYMAANTVSQDLALGIVALLLRLGVLPYCYATPREPSHTIEGRKVRQSETLYYVKCRREAWDDVPHGGRLCYRETADGLRVPIKEISRIPHDGPVYNLEVDDADHSYTACGVAVGNCQNFETSQIGEGTEVSPHDLANMMLRLQEEGCHNINFVTPEHVVAQILEALPIAIEGGLRLPLVYNTSSYDSAHSIQLMDGVVDIYMPDFKLWDRERSRRYLLAPDYPEAARTTVRAMHEQVGELVVNEDGLGLRGVIVRHLVMPGMLEDTREIMRYLAGLSTDTYVNVMDQYYPAYRAKTEEKFWDINRRIFRQELNEAYKHARAAGLWRFDTRWRRMQASAWD